MPLKTARFVPGEFIRFANASSDFTIFCDLGGVACRINDKDIMLLLRAHIEADKSTKMLVFVKNRVGVIYAFVDDTVECVCSARK